MDNNDIRQADAVELAEHHWQVFPLRGKAPAIPRAHPPTLYTIAACIDNIVASSNPLRHCKGGCGRLGHGLYDATDDVDTVIEMWNRHPHSNIGGRVPESMLMIDIDPRTNGDEAWAALLRKYGLFPECHMTISGRGDGGRHLYVRRPPGKIKARLCPGIDLKTSAGYAVMPRSVHPDSGKPYVRADGPVPAPPEWFMDLVTVRPLAPSVRRARSVPLGSGPSLADRYCASVSWADVLEPHEWTCLDHDPDAEGARWQHPDATSACSATMRNDCLFVYSTNTPFTPTEAGDPHGYTKFRAYAALNHDGDLKTAARAIRKGGVK